MQRKAKPKLAPVYVRQLSPRSLLLPNEEWQRYKAEAGRHWTLQREALALQQMRKLLKAYGLDFRNPVCWYMLAWSLANDYVPNFKVKSYENKRGRKLRQKSFALVLEIDATSAENKVSVRKACSLLAKNKNLPWNRSDPRTTEATYYAQKKHIYRNSARTELYEIWRKLIYERPDLIRWAQPQAERGLASLAPL